MRMLFGIILLFAISGISVVFAYRLVCRYAGWALRRFRGLGDCLPTLLFLGVVVSIVYGLASIYIVATTPRVDMLAVAAATACWWFLTGVLLGLVEARKMIW